MVKKNPTNLNIAILRIYFTSLSSNDNTYILNSSSAMYPPLLVSIMQKRLEPN